MPAFHRAASSRRHDLDALRAFAMLLGIGLHGALSFLPVPWPVHDGQQSLLLGWFVSAVHGFRMPVFFVMSGFFTAMLWRRRGLRSLLEHRFRRIALPLLLGLVTLVPAIDWISQRGLELGPGEAPSPAPGPTAPLPTTTVPDELDAIDPTSGITPLSQAVLDDDARQVAARLAAGAAVDTKNRDGSSALILATLFGRSEAATLLIDAGADLDLRSADGSTALHIAAFFGRGDIGALLIAAGADSTLENGYGQVPRQVLAADWATTQSIALMFGQSLDQEQVETARARIAALLGDANETIRRDEAVQATLARWLHQPFFHHLWFLWFLCWLVAAFAVYASVADRFGWRGLPRGWVLSPWRLLWLIPITFGPQLFMGRLAPVFGADTSAGLLPLPHVLAYYAVFFFFGAFYFDARDDEGRVGRWWFVSLPVGLLLLFPVGAGLAFSTPYDAEPAARRLSALLQATYPWVVTFGLMGGFRRFLSRPSPTLRYLSDASYWLYLAHLPLILGAQIAVRNWQLPALVKLSLLCLAVTAVLLLIYRYAVRPTWLGRLLNGRQARGIGGPRHPLGLRRPIDA